LKRQRYLVDDSAYPVFLTTTIVKWLPLFADSQMAEEALVSLEEIRKEMAISIIAYVLMPSHLHAIAKTQAKGDLSIFMRKWKSQSARAILEHCARCHPHGVVVFKENAREYKVRSDQEHQVWMPRFDDFAIRNEKQMMMKINYIHGNPVKSGLVMEYEDYPYSSFRDYTGGKNGYVTIDCGQGKP